MLCIMPDSSGQDVKSYLEYLDKEMTIMGILSTFCVAAAFLVIDRVCGADKSSTFSNWLNLGSRMSSLVLVSSCWHAFASISSGHCLRSITAGFA
jgi:hypothetical protein